jgi:acyl carrier protein
MRNVAGVLWFNRLVDSSDDLAPPIEIESPAHPSPPRAKAFNSWDDSRLTSSDAQTSHAHRSAGARHPPARSPSAQRAEPVIDRGSTSPIARRCACRGAIELPHPLRYYGRSTSARGWGGPGHIDPGPSRVLLRQPDGRRNTLPTKDLPMSSTFDAVANIIAETCDIPRDTIKPESHAINDLGIDSLDFLDVAFAIDKAFGIKMPLEQWTQEVNEGKATTEQYFVLNNLCAHIDELVAAKGK